jgi:hypothetical protein
MKTRFYFPIVFSFLLLAVGDSFAAELSNDPVKGNSAKMTEAEKKARLEQMNKRVNEISAIDRSTLTKRERKALRKEVRDLQKEMRGRKGIFFGIGGIILIIILLVIIL